MGVVELPIRNYPRGFFLAPFGKFFPRFVALGLLAPPDLGLRFLSHGFSPLVLGLGFISETAPSSRSISFAQFSFE